jgi:putative transposase
MPKFAYKYELFPTQEQIKLLNKSCAACRKIWNAALARCNAELEKPKESQRSINKVIAEFSAEIPLMKKTEEWGWISEVNAQSLIGELQHLKDAWKACFSKKKGRPKFKKWSDPYQSFSNQNDLNSTQNKIRIWDIGLAKLKIIKFNYPNEIIMDYHRPIDGTITTVTITRTPTNRWFASIGFKNDKDFPAKPHIIQETTVGIDVGLKDFIVDSNGKHVKNRKVLSKIEGKIAFLSRNLELKRSRNPNWKDSGEYKKLKLELAKVHEKLANCRKDFIHKLTHKIVTNNDTIALETLNVSGMMKNKHLSKRIGQTGFYEFKRQIKYKAEYRGKNVIELNQWERTTGECNLCGYVVGKLPLHIRQWNCQQCGANHDRDENAAKVIKKKALGCNAE